MIALYIYVAFSYLFMIPYIFMDWKIRGKYNGESICTFIPVVIFSPISMPIVLGVDSKGGN